MNFDVSKTSLAAAPAAYSYVAGCDEAGRGCLAGPVFAAAVVLPKTLSPDLLYGLNDSKSLSENDRNTLRPLIEQEAISYCCSSLDNVEIDRINILNASIKAMHISLGGLAVVPDLILVDGNRFVPYEFIPYQCIIKGDGKYLCIAAASILAKTWRDEYMKTLHDAYPRYGWADNKGYPTKKHKEALRLYGPTHLHRHTFAGVL